MSAAGFWQPAPMEILIVLGAFALAGLVAGIVFYHLAHAD
jgi:hypothetical protein